MQNRYVGDIGDFVKLAILRALMPGYQLGVAWWLYPDEDHNKDGRHIGYLDQPAKWRAKSLDLFDGLSAIVAANQRQVSALEQGNFLPGAIYSREPIPVHATPAERRLRRPEWLLRVQRQLADCDLVFVDPDNGLEPDRYSPGTRQGGKCVTIEELKMLSKPARVLVVYHHQTRRKGGHIEEIAYWARRLHGEGLNPIGAIRAQPFSARAFFILNGNAEIQNRAEELGGRWGGKLTWHPYMR